MRRPGGPQEAPRSAQEAPRRHPGGQGHLGVQMCVFILCFFNKSDAGDHFCVDCSDPTITIYRACAQDFVGRGAKNWWGTLAPQANSKKLFWVDCFLNLAHFSAEDIQFSTKLSMWPKGSPKEAKESQRAGQRNPRTPKGSPKGAQGHPKGAKGIPKLGKRKPKGQN